MHAAQVVSVPSSDETPSDAIISRLIHIAVSGIRGTMGHLNCDPSSSEGISGTVDFPPLIFFTPFVEYV